MSVQFLLPCSCGQSIPVARSQSGLEVQCPQCGHKQVVPKLARLQQLPVVHQEEAKRQWGPRQLTMFIGTIIALVGVAFALLTWWWLPPSPMEKMEKLYGPLPEDATPEEALLLWQMIRREGLDPRFPVPRGVYNFESYYGAWKGQRNWIWIWLGVAGVGLLVSAIGLLEAPRRSSRPAGRAGTSPQRS